MGGVKTFQIQLDNPIATYYGGQNVSGNIIVQLEKEKSLRGIKVNVYGRADVEWTESRSETDSEGKSRTVYDTYSAHEQYFEFKQYVVGSQDGDMALPMGDHVFPFRITLPPNLPSSFEGEYGNVRYYIKAKMKRHTMFNREAKAVFTVLSTLDLNTMPEIKEPCQVEKEKYLCCCCCKSGPITMVANIPVTGYVPGQDIPITIEVDNVTTETIMGVHCNLMKTVTFHAQPGSSKRTTESKVASGQSASVGPHGSGCETVKLTVPSVPPSYLTHCKIIDIEYELKVKGIISGPHSDIKKTIPIIIGTIPLTSFFPKITPATAAPLPEKGTELPPTSMGWNVTPSAPGFAPYPPGPPVPGSTPYPPGPPVPGSTPYPPGPPVPGSTPYPPVPPVQGSTPYSPDPSGPGFTPYPSGPSAPGFSPPPLGPSAPDAAPSFAPSAPLEPQTMYPEMPPPSYEESVFGTKNAKEKGEGDHVQGVTAFAPRYPMMQKK